MKKEFKGTIGKWEVFKQEGYDIAVNCGEEEICDFLFSDKQKSEANAKLIASAPEMLELLSELENDDESIPNWIWIRIKKVLDDNLT